MVDLERKRHPDDPEFSVRWDNSGKGNCGTLQGDGFFINWTRANHHNTLFSDEAFYQYNIFSVDGKQLYTIIASVKGENAFFHRIRKIYARKMNIFRIPKYFEVIARHLSIWGAKNAETLVSSKGLERILKSAGFERTEVPQHVSESSSSIHLEGKPTKPVMYLHRRI